MTLTNRLLTYFLATLAFVLVGFSTALYFLAADHLYRQAENRLDAALNTLVAAVEVQPNGVEWEPDVRQLPFDSHFFGGLVVWSLTDDSGVVVEGSKDQDVRARLADIAAHWRNDQDAAELQTWGHEHWQFRSRRLTATSPDAPKQPFATRFGWTYPALTMTAGVSLEPVRATLRQLAGWLAALSLGVWLISAVAGLSVCRRGLLPVKRMAQSAQAMTVADMDHRLPAIMTGDELQDLSRSFNGLLDRLQESFERQRRFTGDASHQLRTPLTTILGQLEVALRRERSSDEYRRVLTAVHERAGHLQRIVESLLFLARSDADAQLPDRETIDLREWLTEHLTLWSQHPRFGDMQSAIIGEGPWSVAVQPAMLGELLNILMDNACKYSTPESPIVLRLKRDGAEIGLEVEDRGCGIEESDVRNLFTPFYRSEDARRRGIEGLGLGLSIAQRLAKSFGGAVTVQSRVGAGSCFRVTLPAIQRSQTEALSISAASI